jgi:DNA repair exonuclease SbcCD nuclease subunit
MLKILHTADIHLGAKFSGLGDKSISQRWQIKDTFKNIIATAVDEKVNIVLIAGDLFDSNIQPQRNIDLAIEQFNLLERNNILICLIPGTHDRLDSSSIYRKVNFEERCRNLKIFFDEGINHKEYPELDLTVYGSLNLGGVVGVSPLEGLSCLTSTRYHVAMAHGSLYIPGKVEQDEYIFTTDEIEKSGMNYIALGHWHNAQPCSERRVVAWYCGAPEWLSWDQRGKGSVLLVSIFDSGEVKVEPKSIGVRSCDEVEIDMGEIRDFASLKDKICCGAHPDLARKVILKGICQAELVTGPEEIEQLEGELASGFFSLKIVNKSYPQLVEVSEERYRDHPMISKLIGLAKKDIEVLEGEEREIAQDALQYGVALLEGREVL